MSKNKKYPIEKSEKAWKAELSPEEFKILREKGHRVPLYAANTTITMKREPIYARVVELHFTKVKVNLTAIVDGPVMTNPSKGLWS